MNLRNIYLNNFNLQMVFQNKQNSELELLPIKKEYL